MARKEKEMKGKDDSQERLNADIAMYRAKSAGRNTYKLSIP